ncbi:sensor histidine kinase [Desulfobotulus mexicanus]|uniref:histidine kinase n=1 Tax=Desulfobotulus mexicanus TaxID=2586642 RepID=A0A5S5MEZ6_9BACT|nr:ATP-binding protein [Desulfobotulus mexicanus]TYT74274.1 hypothetical protein FIM25_10920 [Desulfobotulus mexicanus]
MKLKTRLFLILGIVISGFMGISGFSSYFLFKTQHLKKAEAVCTQAMTALMDLRGLTTELLVTETLDISYTAWQEAGQILDSRLKDLHYSTHLRSLLKTEALRATPESLMAFWQSTRQWLDRADHDLGVLLTRKEYSRDGLIYQVLDSKDYGVLEAKKSVDAAALFLAAEFETKLSDLISMVEVEIRTQTRNTMKNIILLSFSISLVACIILTLFLSQLNRYLKIWKDAMFEVGRGNFPAEIPVTGKDELNEISMAINETSADLKAMHETLKQKLEELSEAKDEAESASKAKGLFLASMSHEFRTPLNAIIGFSRLALRQTRSVNEHQQLASILRNGEHLLNLINQVLTTVGLETGRVQLSEGKTDLDCLISDMETMFLPKAREKGLKLEACRSPALPRYIIMDRLRLSQVLINLLDNAIKSTRSGHVSLSIKPDRKYPHHILFCVEDTGCGITEEEIPSLFKPFNRLKDIERNAGGAGLGLSICHNLIGLMQGEFEVHSEKEKGSTFSFHLPLIPCHVEAHTPEASPLRSQTDPLPAKILQDNTIQPRIPETLLHTLESAIEKAEFDHIQHLIFHLEQHDRNFGRELENMAENFDYERMLFLLKSRMSS